MIRKKKKDRNLVTKAKIDIDHLLYELPENHELEQRDRLIENLGVAAGNLLDAENRTRQEEEDVVLEQIKEEYGFEDIKDAFDNGYVPDSVYFFCGWESENFARAVEFLGPDADNRKFAAFSLSDLGRQVMTSNRLLIHVETGDIFYENHITGENFYNFLNAQQNKQAAFIPRKIFLSKEIWSLH